MPSLTAKSVNRPSRTRRGRPGVKASSMEVAREDWPIGTWDVTPLEVIGSKVIPAVAGL
jgi:hypothetical protein